MFKIIQKTFTDQKPTVQRSYQPRSLYQPEPPAGFVPRSNPNFAGLNRRWF
jgi:hypothetical protein